MKNIRKILIGWLICISMVLQIIPPAEVQASAGLKQEDSISGSGQVRGGRDIKADDATAKWLYKKLYLREDASNVTLRIKKTESKKKINTVIKKLRKKVAELTPYNLEFYYTISEGGYNAWNFETNTYAGKSWWEVYIYAHPVGRTIDVTRDELYTSLSEFKQTYKSDGYIQKLDSKLGDMDYFIDNGFYIFDNTTDGFYLGFCIYVKCEKDELRACTKELKTCLQEENQRKPDVLYSVRYIANLGWDEENDDSIDTGYCRLYIQYPLKYFYDILVEEAAATQS